MLSGEFPLLRGWFLQHRCRPPEFSTAPTAGFLPVRAPVPLQALRLFQILQQSVAFPTSRQTGGSRNSADRSSAHFARGLHLSTGRDREAGREQHQPDLRESQFGLVSVLFRSNDVRGMELGRKCLHNWDRIWISRRSMVNYPRFVPVACALDGHSWPFPGGAGIRPVLQHGSPDAGTLHPLFRPPPSAAGGKGGSMVRWSVHPC